MNIHEAQQPIPSHIGHYEIVSIIGRGGMGIVYLARDPRLERQVAIKCLRTELFENHYRERFKREALLLAKLNHPHIVQIYDFIESPEQLALVMEYVNGHNLQIHLREHIANFSQRLQWLTQITQGLAIAHDAGIIHRDLKTENILINKQGIAKISDLGIAKSQDFNATITDHVAGSYCSMSPEQAMGEAINFKSDLFSLGILAYQLLCGAHPFGDTNNKLQVMQRIISHPPIPPVQHNPDLPAEVTNLLGQLLAKNPDNRPDNTHWVAAEFEKLRQFFPTSQAFGSNDTQALVAFHSNTSNPREVGITENSHYSQDHPTFSTSNKNKNRHPKNSLWAAIVANIKANAVSISMISLTILILGSLTVWQFQPKPPRYVAVIPPTLNTKELPEIQQELLKTAVYDAIQQSVIQIDALHLIPQSEIANINGDLETIHRAAAADELITADLQCKLQVCTIVLSQLTTDSAQKNGRLNVIKRKSFDVLSENYISIAGIVQSSIAAIYSSKINTSFNKINEESYAKFLQISADYKNKGADQNLLDELNALNKELLQFTAFYTLYREISLDIFHQNSDEKYLLNLEKVLGNHPQKTDNENYLYDMYYLLSHQNKIQETLVIEDALERIGVSSSALNELRAYKMMLTKDYLAAAKLYERILKTKPTANNFFHAANAYWYVGDTTKSKQYVNNCLNLSPDNHEALSLKGIIYLTEGDINQATVSFEKIVKENTNDLHNLSNLGLCYLLNKKYELAINTFNKAASLSPENTTLLLNFADAQNLSGNTIEANAAYLKVVSDIGNEYSTSEEMQLLSQAFSHLGRDSKALEVLRQLERLDGMSIETYYTAALVNALTNNASAAIFNIENTIKNGMHPIWFSFPWFDKLCNEESFILLMNSNGEHQRCPQKNN